MKTGKFLWRTIFTAIILLYILLRFWHLTDSCLWFDEIFSIHAASHDWKNIFQFVARDLIHPPLFYVLLKIWISIGGENLFWLRFFPVFFSIIAVFPFLLLCRQLKLSAPTTLLALAFFAANGSLIKYAQEVRMYSLLLCLALFSMWLFLRFVNWGKGFSLLILINILLVYSHYFGWLIVASEVAAVAILVRHRLKHILLMFAATTLGFAPWIYAIRQASKTNSDVGQNIGWMTKPNFTTIFQFIFDLFEPIYFEQSNRDQTAIFFITLPIMAIGIVGFGFYFADWQSKTKIEKRSFLLLLIFLFLPISTAFLASWILPYSVWGTRHLIIAFAPLTILLATAISGIKLQKLKIAVVSTVCLLFAWAFFLQSTGPKPNYIWCAWENLALSLSQDQTNSNEPTKIYVFEDLVAYHFWFALRDSDRKFKVIKINGIENLIEDKAYFLPRGFDEVKSADNFDGERFFVAFRAENWNQNAAPLQNLKAQGYKIGEPQMLEAQGLKAFLVEANK